VLTKRLLLENYLMIYILPPISKESIVVKIFLFNKDLYRIPSLSE